MESESDIDPDEMFDSIDNQNLTIRKQGTSENLHELLGNRSSYYGDFLIEEERLSIQKGSPSNKNRESDLVRYVDQEVQTINQPVIPKLNLKKIEEEKFSPRINDDSIELRMEETSRTNDSMSSILSPGRKDALEEYFKMSVLALKIAHQDLDSVCQLKSSHLYYKAKMKKIPFQEWQPWIEQELNSMYLNSFYHSHGRGIGILRVSGHEKHLSDIGLLNSSSNSNSSKRKKLSIKDFFTKNGKKREGSSNYELLEEQEDHRSSKR